MTTTDARGNNHQGAGAPGAGEFAKKMNSQQPNGLASFADAVATLAGLSRKYNVQMATIPQPATTQEEWTKELRTAAASLGAHAAFEHDSIDLDNGDPRDIYDLFQEVTGRDYDPDHKADVEDDERDILAIAAAYEEGHANTYSLKPTPGDADLLLSRYEDAFADYQAAQAVGNDDAAYEQYEDAMMDVVGELAATLRQYRAAERATYASQESPASGAATEQNATVRADVEPPEPALDELDDGQHRDSIDVLAFYSGAGSVKRYADGLTEGLAREDNIEKEPNL